jgi:hypothetical protein
MQQSGNRTERKQEPMSMTIEEADEIYRGNPDDRRRIAATFVLEGHRAALQAQEGQAAH